MATEPDLCRAAAGWNRARRAAAAALAVAFAVLLPVAVTSAWIRGTVLSTSGYVAAATPVAANPAVRDTVQEVITTQVRAALKHAETSLPPAAGVLAGPLSTGLADLAGNRISEFMASSAFQRLWAEVNRFAHSQLISVLNGDSTLVQATGGQVVLNLVPLVNDVLHRISGQLSSMTRSAMSLPSVSTIPAAACRVLPRSSSPACAQIPLFPAAALAGPRHAYRILIAATWLAPALTALAFASALAASPRHAGDQDAGPVAASECMCRAVRRHASPRVARSHPDLGEAHLRTVLAEFARHYNGHRPHQSLRQEPPRQPGRAVDVTARIEHRQVLGGPVNPPEPVISGSPSP